MGYCSGCGNEIGENDKFCKSCGKSLTGEYIFDQAIEHYNLLSSILKDLQPVAFFISALLILAGFLKDDPLYQKYALFASILFFLAYLGLASFKVTKYRIFFYWGLILIIVAIKYIYDSFGGIVSIISDITDENFRFIIYSIIVSVFIVFSRYFLYFSDSFSIKNNWNKLSHIMFWAGVILIYLFVYTNVYSNFNTSIIGLYFGALFMYAGIFVSTLNIDPIKAKNWLDKIGILSKMIGIKQIANNFFNRIKSQTLRHHTQSQQSCGA